MTGKAEVYEVQTLSNGRWTIQSRCRTEQQAVAEAHEFFDRRQCVGVKVVKEAFDEKAQLYREFTVFRLPGSTSGAAGQKSKAGDAMPGQGGLSAADKTGRDAQEEPRGSHLLDLLAGFRALTSPLARRAPAYLGRLFSLL